jgi:16S rRNA (cytosine1402-N4)-methyltransferase
MHIPVLQKEALEYLDPKPNENFIDATIGEMGHTIAILEKNKPNGKVLGIDWDAEVIKKLKFQERIILVNDSYANLKEIVEKNNFNPVQGILLDLGMSSWHLEESGRGFTFMKNEPLDMRYQNKAQNYLTAEEIINKYPREEIERILKEYGEERFAKRIAERIIAERKIRPIKTTMQLVEILRRSIPVYGHQKIHFATRTFQALRIAVNGELDNLKRVLPQVLEVLNKGGRIVVISFHSLEDRIVKEFFRNNKEVLKILTKKPITSTDEEIISNRRARSAKLRAAMKIL